MNPSLKAALLSALIFPGVGQLAAGYKKRGWVIITANAVLLYLIFGEIMQKAYHVLTEMQKNGNAMDIEAISNVTTKLSGFSDNTYLNILLTMLIISWVYAIFDAYRIALHKEQ